MYHVVETSEFGGRTCYIIPSSWMMHDKGACYWPPGLGAESKVKNKKPPNPQSWLVYPTMVLKTVETYEEARQWLIRAQYESDLNTDNEEVTTPKRQRVFKEKSNDYESEDASDESSQITPPPSLPSGSGSTQGSYDFQGQPTHGNIFTEEEVNSIIENQNSQRQPISTVDRSPTFSVPSISTTPKSTGKTKQRHSLPFSRQKTVGPPTTDDSFTVLELLKKIALDTSIIKQTVSNIESRLGSLERSFRDSHTKTANQEILKFLAVRFDSIEKFQNFDAHLTEDSCRLLMAEMASCGGDTVVEFVGRVLRKLMTDEVAKLYSLWGHKDNEHFSLTNTWSTLKASALSNRKLLTDEREVEKACMNWFRHAGDRIMYAKASPATK